MSYYLSSESEGYASPHPSRSPSVSSSDEFDNPNVSRIDPFPDPSSITAGIHPQTQDFIKSQGPIDFSGIANDPFSVGAFEINQSIESWLDDLSTSGIENEEPPAPEFDDNRERNAGVGGRQFSERYIDHSIGSWFDDMAAKGGTSTSGVTIQEPPAPEFDNNGERSPKSLKAKGKQEVDNPSLGHLPMSEEEEDSPFLLCLSTSEEEDDYNTLKFLVAFRFSGGLLVPSSAITLSDFIKKKLPEDYTITESQCRKKMWKLYDKFVELRAKFNGVERQEGREYEMFEMGRFVWNHGEGTSSKNADPETSVQQQADSVRKDPRENVDQGIGADPTLNVDHVAGDGDPSENVYPQNGADPRENMDPGSGAYPGVQQGIDAAMKDPGENVGPGIDADPTVKVDHPGTNMDPGNGADPTVKVVHPGTNMDPGNGADPREDMDLEDGS